MRDIYTPFCLSEAGKRIRESEEKLDLGEGNRRNVAERTI
jgi:hypothetical protein